MTDMLLVVASVLKMRFQPVGGNTEEPLSNWKAAIITSSCIVPVGLFIVQEEPLVCLSTDAAARNAIAASARLIPEKIRLTANKLITRLKTIFFTFHRIW